MEKANSKIPGRIMLLVELCTQLLFPAIGSCDSEVLRSSLGGTGHREGGDPSTSSRACHVKPTP